MYDPITARFMQEDTYLGQKNDPLSLNLYTYCHNSPLMYWDPTGHSAEATFGGQKLGANAAADNMAQREMRKVLNKWNPIASSVGDAARRSAAGSSNNGYSYSKKFETLSVTGRVTIADGVKESAAKALHTMSCRSYNNLWSDEDYLAEHIQSTEAATALEWAPPKLVDMSILYYDPGRTDRFVQFAKGFVQGLKDTGDGAGDVFKVCLVIDMANDAYWAGEITFEERAQIIAPLIDTILNTGAGFVSGAGDNAIKINTPIGAINTLGALVYLDTGNTAILDFVGSPFQQKDAYLIDKYDLNEEQYYNGKAGADTYVTLAGLAVSLYSSVSARAGATAAQASATINKPKTEAAQLARDGKTPVIGKMKDLNKPGAIGSNEFRVADYLPDQGTPKLNWQQNDGVLRSIMNERVPIRDASLYPMENAGFLGAERYLLSVRGWIYRDGYWYPPQGGL